MTEPTHHFRIVKTHHPDEEKPWRLAMTASPLDGSDATVYHYEYDTSEEADAAIGDLWAILSDGEQ